MGIATAKKTNKKKNEGVEKKMGGGKEGDKAKVSVTFV